MGNGDGFFKKRERGVIKLFKMTKIHPFSYHFAAFGKILQPYRLPVLGKANSPKGFVLIIES